MTQEKHFYIVFCVIINVHMKKLYFVLRFLILLYYYYQKVAYLIFAFGFLLIFRRVCNAISVKTRNREIFCTRLQYWFKIKCQCNIVFIFRLLIKCFKIFVTMIAYLEVYQMLSKETLCKFYLLFVKVLELQL